ncbi:MAG TPA: hypothetical protein VGE41_11605 [Verrucomicrobiae bacterium]
MKEKLEQDNPELEVELLKAVEGAHSPYSDQEMDAILKRVIAEERQHGKT